MNPNALQTLISEGEDTRYQFKRHVNQVDGFAAEPVAFGNTAGGMLLIGVADNGVIGVLTANDVNRLNQSLSNAASQSVKPTINLGATRNWGHAKDYIEMQWLMQQQDKPLDFVIAAALSSTACVTSSRQPPREVGMRVLWEGEGAEGRGYWENRYSCESRNLETGETIIVAVDLSYFHCIEVETVLGAPPRAKAQLGRIPQTELVCSYV